MIIRSNGGGEMTQRAFGYIRVSSLEQVGGHSLTAQERAMVECVALEGHKA